ncbi:MAG: hypothetical protein GF317_04665 [Candidatus Lokiarchaeota archaeon]|nr:hypothetical protein [Candidatus Lokiarchaeota archaeon]
MWYSEDLGEWLEKREKTYRDFCDAKLSVLTELLIRLREGGYQVFLDNSEEGE